MPHKCIRCGLLYGSGAEELLKGCGCGSRIFVFLRPESITLKEQMELLEREGREFVAENRQALEDIAEIAPISIERAPELEKETKADPSKQDASPSSPVQIDIGEMGKPIDYGEIPDVNKIAAELRKEHDDSREAKEIAEHSELEAAKTGEKPAENITILEKGRYLLDLQSLMSGSPMVIRSEHGVFYIRIPTAVTKNKAKK
ncbi:MAG: Zn-ribbon containing protein [Candidatus Micrarchaeota archaeon]